MKRRQLAVGIVVLPGLGLAGCVVPPQALPSSSEPVPAPPPPPEPPPIPQPPAFSAAAPGGPPPGWTAQPLPHRKPTEYTVVAHEGRHVLQARADAAAGVLRCAFDADPQATPWLQWQWRTDSLIAGATVADPKRDDAPLRVMVVFGATRLVYVWDGMAASEQPVAHPGPGRVHSLVVERGGDRTGQWLSYRRNLVDDHRRAFGEAPGRVTAIELLTDSDDLATRALAWYGDITFGR